MPPRLPALSRSTSTRWRRSSERQHHHHQARLLRQYRTATIDNDDFRRVLYTGQHLQLVLMTLTAGRGNRRRNPRDRDQFFRFEEGEGVVDIDGKANPVREDFAVIVPAGARHNVRNTGSGPLRMYTLYGPPEHTDNGRSDQGRGRRQPRQRMGRQNHRIGLPFIPRHPGLDPGSTFFVTSALGRQAGGPRVK